MIMNEFKSQMAIQYIKLSNYQIQVKMKMENDIVVDQLRINDKYIQFQYQNARNTNRTNQLLTETFKFLDLARIYEINPNDQQNRQSMKNILNSRFIPQHQNTQPKYTLDLTQAHPLNKLGNFGRQLQRKCRLTGKQIMQFEDGNPAKPKLINSFKNKVQNFADKRDVDSKIGWIADNKTYPFRIVLVDKNAGHKGVYFSSYEKAESIRIFLTQNFLYKGNFPQIIKVLSSNHIDSTLQAFKEKLISKNKILKKSNMFSKSNVAGQRSQADFKQSTPAKNFINDYQPQTQPPQNTSLYYKADNINKQSIPQPVYQDYNKAQKNNIYNIHNDYQKNNNYNMNNQFAGSVNNSQRNKFNRYIPLRQLQESYKKDFFKNWQEKARNHSKKESFNHSRVHYENKNMYGNNNISQSYVKSNLNNNFSQKISKRHEPLNNFKQRDNESQIDRLGLSNVNKQSIIKSFHKENHSNEELLCHSIQFLTLKNLFFKPIVTLQLYRQNKLQQTILYNTIIKRKQPFLLYELLQNEDESLYLMANLRQYDLHIKVIDFLANQEVINDKFTMKTKKVIDKTILLSNAKLIKIQMSIKHDQLYQKTNQNEQNLNSNAKVSLNMADLSPEVKEKIKSYWQKQGEYQGYYNQTNISVYKILSQIQSVPLTWWKDVTQDDYDLYQVINNASKILGFKMLRSFKHIIKVFYQMYPDLEQMTEKLIAFIIFYLKPYYFPQNYTRLQRFHRLIGLQDDSEFISKVNLEIITLNKIIEIQCPSLTDKLSRRNIVYGYTMMQYIYEFFSRNLAPNCLIQFWNFLSLQMDSLQMHMVLACAALIKYYEEELLKAKRLKQFSQILQSLKVNKAQFIIKEIIALKQKYFGQSKGFLDQIKNIFNNKPLQPVLGQFFKRQTSILDKRKVNKQIQKKGVMKKVNKQIDMDLPQYDKKKYCLHIYFSKGPSVNGSLTIRCNNVDYECLNFEKNKYFILSQVSDFVNLIFLDLKSNEYSCQLVLSQGINQYTAYLSSPKNSNQYKVTYIAGLLTDSQIDIFKRGKKFEHFVSPFVKKIEFYEQMNRPIQQAFFLRKYDSGNSRDELMKKIKTLFCTGSKAFDQIQFYLQQIQTRNLTIQQQFSLVQSYARQLSTEFTLSHNQIYQKLLVKLLLQKTGYIMDDYQFECYYNDSLDYEFDAPKIIRCRFIVTTPFNKELKLQLQALQYFIEKCSNYVFSDIIIDDFIFFMKDHIVRQTGSNLFQGELKLLYSSQGEIFSKNWSVRVKNKNKELQFEQIKQDSIDDVQQKQIGQPQILMTEVLPSFAKISTILDYVNSNRNFDLKNRNIEKDKRKIAENINIIKDSYIKFSKIITMRYQQYPKQYNFPFFNYYYEIIKDNQPPVIKPIFLNNIKSDIKSICGFSAALKFSDHPKVQAFQYDHQKGLYGNLRLFARDSKTWFFFGDKHEEESKIKNEGRVFINYGYGVFRWQHCIVLGYTNRVKPCSHNRNAEKRQQKHTKKHYLIRLKNQERQVFEYELQLLCNVQAIPELMDPSLKKMSNYMDDNEDGYKQGNGLKYLNKFIR